MTKYERFSKAFKIEAGRLLESGDKTAAEIALDLSIRRNRLYKWREQILDKGDSAFCPTQCD